MTIKNFNKALNILTKKKENNIIRMKHGYEYIGLKIMSTVCLLVLTFFIICAIYNALPSKIDGCYEIVDYTGNTRILSGDEYWCTEGDKLLCGSTHGSGYIEVREFKVVECNEDNNV